MASNRSLQLLRNNTVFSSLTAAKDAMASATTQDGVAVLGRYTSDNKIKTVLGIQHAMDGGTGMTFFENSSAIDALQAELDRTQTAAGLDTDGNFVKPTGWTSASTTTLSAIQMIADKIEGMDANSVSGESKVVIDVTQENGQLTATSANLTGVKLDGYTEGTDADIVATDTLGQALGKLQAQINAMDKAADVVDGQVVTTVSEADGKVTETKANVKDLQLGGYAKDANATGDIASADTINTALSKLENTVGANKITNDDHSIVVTEPSGTATTTDVKVNIKSGEKVIKLGNDGIYTNLNLVKITTGLGATVKESYEFRDSDGNKIGESIDIAKDSHIVSITYDEATQKLIYKYLDASGTEQTVEVDMAHLILETEVENGVQSVNGKLSIKLDTTGDDTGDGKFLTVGADGLKLDGVTDAITAAIEALDATGDTAVAGQYVAEIQEVDGIVSVKSRANVSDAVLNGYEKGTKPASTAIAATDDVKGAIAKLEHQIDDAKAAATTKVVEGTDAGNNMEIVPTTGADQSVTYTINLTDVASDSALTAEIAARKAVDGQTGQAYAANTSANYISTATSLNDADVLLDAALKALDEEVVKAIGSSNGSISAVTSGTNGYDLVTDTSKIRLSSFTESSSSAETAPQDGQTLNEALAAIYATAKHHHLTASNEGVTVATTSGGTTVGLNLDQAETAERRQNGAYAHPQSNNVLSVDSEGLYLSNVWDCGTYDEVQP